jgi:hypothetical protein
MDLRKISHKQDQFCVIFPVDPKSSVAILIALDESFLGAYGIISEQTRSRGAAIFSLLELTVGNKFLVQDSGSEAWLYRDHSSQRRPGSFMLEKLTHDDFFNRLHQKFLLHYEGGTMETELIECRKLPSLGRPDRQRKPFAIIFRGPRQPVLVQRIYKLEGSSMGPLELFIVPVGPDATGMRYEAIFS